MNAIVAEDFYATRADVEPDYRQAEHFLTLLDGNAENFTFQTFDDNKARKDPTLAKVLHGSLEAYWQELYALSRRGAGVFVTVNQTNSTGRKTADITRIRAVFQECDCPGTPEPPLKPHIVVESSPGKFHRYFLVDGGAQFNLFEGVMARMVADFDSDPNAKDRARVLRLPGFPHQKDPANPWLVRIVEESGELPYTWSQVTAKIPPLEHTQAAPPASSGIPNPRKVQAALCYLVPCVI